MLNSERQPSRCSLDNHAFLTRKRRNTMRRLILVPLLIVVAVLAIGGGIAYVIYNNYMFYNTDDAQVNGTIVNVSAPTTGVLTTLSVKVGDTVSAGQAIGTITPALAASTAGKGAPVAIDVTSPTS